MEYILTLYDINRAELRNLISEWKLDKYESSRVPKNDFYTYYVTENHTWGETKEHFGLNEGGMRRNIRQWNI